MAFRVRTVVAAFASAGVAACAGLIGLEAPTPENGLESGSVDARAGDGTTASDGGPPGDALPLDETFGGGVVAIPNVVGIAPFQGVLAYVTGGQVTLAGEAAIPVGELDTHGADAGSVVFTVTSVAGERDYRALTLESAADDAGDEMLIAGGTSDSNAGMFLWARTVHGGAPRNRTIESDGSLLGIASQNELNGQTAMLVVDHGQTQITATPDEDNMLAQVLTTSAPGSLAVAGPYVEALVVEPSNQSAHLFVFDFTLDTPGVVEDANALANGRAFEIANAANGDGVTSAVVIGSTNDGELTTALGGADGVYLVGSNVMSSDEDAGVKTITANPAAFVQQLTIKSGARDANGNLYIAGCMGTMPWIGRFNASFVADPTLNGPMPAFPGTCATVIRVDGSNRAYALLAPPTIDAGPAYIARFAAP